MLPRIMTYSVRNEWQKLRFEQEMEQRLFVNSNQLSRKVDLLADYLSSSASVEI